MRLVPLLNGKALQAYTRLSVEDSDNYDTIKNAIFMRYKLNTEAYRKKFRGTFQGSEDTYWEFRVQMEQKCCRWMEYEKVKTYEDLHDLILKEQLLNNTPIVLREWLKESKPKNVNDLVDIADVYQTAHGTGAGKNRVYSNMSNPMEIQKTRDNTGFKGRERERERGFTSNQRK